MVHTCKINKQAQILSNPYLGVFMEFKKIVNQTAGSQSKLAKTKIVRVLNKVNE